MKGGIAYADVVTGKGFSPPQAAPFQRQRL